MLISFSRFNPRTHLFLFFFLLIASSVYVICVDAQPLHGAREGKQQQPVLSDTLADPDPDTASESDQLVAIHGQDVSGPSSNEPHQLSTSKSDTPLSSVTSDEILQSLNEPEANPEENNESDEVNQPSSVAKDEEKEDQLEKDSQIGRVGVLLEKNRALRQLLHRLRLNNQEATDDYQDSIHRKNILSDFKQHLQQMRLRLENDIHGYRHQIPIYDRTLSILERQSNSAVNNIARLRNRQFWLIHQKARLAAAFRQRGLENWVKSSLKDSVSPVVAGALAQGTANVVEPMLDGIEKLAAVNDKLTSRMSETLVHQVPLVENPFYSGFVTYTVLLCPLVLVISIILKIKRGIARLTLGHAIILGNFYFGILSGGCFVATTLGSVDVLRTVRYGNKRLFDFLIVLHALLYIWHIFLHIVAAYRMQKTASMGHALVLFAIGLHFTVHSYRHAMHNEDLHVHKRAYAVYTGIFLYLLYELIIRHIRKTDEKKRMILNNASIGNENDCAPAVMVLPSVKRVPLLSCGNLEGNTCSARRTEQIFSRSCPSRSQVEENTGATVPKVSDVSRVYSLSAVRPDAVAVDFEFARDL